MFPTYQHNTFITIHFLEKASTKLYLQGVSSFTIAPVTYAYFIAAHVVGKKVSHGLIKTQT